eukprot:gene4505-6365_t
MSSKFNQLMLSFKDLVLAEKNDLAEAKFIELKKIMLEMDSLPPLCVESASSAADRDVARQIFEYSILLSVNCGDREAFQRNMGSLRPYYTTDNKFGNETSELMYTVLGLNLLFLLVDNRLADFHCELELLSEKQQQHSAITFCTQLDQHLVVGSYDEVLAAAARPPIKYYSFFLKSLLETVRINIGDCCAASYNNLSLASATKILMFNQMEETLDFIRTYYPSWQIEGNQIGFINTKSVKSDEIPSLKLISQTLSYATELERIV